MRPLTAARGRMVFLGVCRVSFSLSIVYLVTLIPHPTLPSFVFSCSFCFLLPELWPTPSPFHLDAHAEAQTPSTKTPRTGHPEFFPMRKSSSMLSSIPRPKPPSGSGLPLVAPKAHFLSFPVLGPTYLTAAILSSHRVANCRLPPIPIPHRSCVTVLLTGNFLMPFR